METVLKLKRGNFHIKAVKNGVVDKVPGESVTGHHQRYRVTVMHNGLKISYPFYDEFYGPISDFPSWHKVTEDDLKYMFERLINDSLCAVDDFQEFCAELGYDEDSRNAYRIYKICKYQKKLFQSFGISTDDIDGIMKELIE